MSDETVKIKLIKGFPEAIETIDEKGKPKKVQPKRIELSNGGKSIVMEVGQETEIPFKDLQLWLNTGHVELAAEIAAPEQVTEGGQA